MPTNNPVKTVVQKPQAPEKEPAKVVVPAGELVAKRNTVVTKLNEIADKLVNEFSGKKDMNPYLYIKQHIKPLVDKVLAAENGEELDAAIKEAEGFTPHDEPHVKHLKP